MESAGTKPGTVRPEAITAMKELDIDISEHRSKHVDELEGQQFDYVITVCDNAKESCPLFMGAVNISPEKSDCPECPYRGSSHHSVKL